MKFCNDPEIICSQINRGFAFLDKNIIPPLERAAKFTHSVVTTDTAKIGALAVGGIALAGVLAYKLKKAFNSRNDLAVINRRPAAPQAPQAAPLAALVSLQAPVARAGARAALVCGVIASLVLGSGLKAVINGTFLWEAGPVLGLAAIFLGSAYGCADLAVKEQVKQDGEEMVSLSCRQLIQVIGKEAGVKGAALLATGALAGYLGNPILCRLTGLFAAITVFTRG